MIQVCTWSTNHTSVQFATMYEVVPAVKDTHALAACLSDFCVACTIVSSLLVLRILIA